MTDWAVFLTPIYCSMVILGLLIKDFIKLIKTNSMKKMIRTSLEVDFLVLALIMLVNII